MEHFKLKVEMCFALISNQSGIRFICYLAQPFFIEQVLAIVQQCNDRTEKRLIERSHC